MGVGRVCRDAPQGLQLVLNRHFPRSPRSERPLNLRQRALCSVRCGPALLNVLRPPERAGRRSSRGHGIEWEIWNEYVFGSSCAL